MHPFHRASFTDKCPAGPRPQCQASNHPYGSDTAALATTPERLAGLLNRRKERSSLPIFQSASPVLRSDLCFSVAYLLCATCMIHARISLGCFWRMNTCNAHATHMPPILRPRNSPKLRPDSAAIPSQDMRLANTVRLWRNTSMRAANEPRSYHTIRHYASY